MSVALPTQTGVKVRQFSEGEMKRYFARIPRWAIVVGIMGILVLLIGLNAQSTGCDGVGVVLLLVGGGVFALTKFGPQPTDQEYDAWVQSKANEMFARAPAKLSLDETATAPLQIHGVIFPGTREADRYDKKEVRRKKGRDGRTRFSINSFSFFFPTEHHLAAYTDVVSAINQSTRSERTEEYFYSDLVGATTAEDQERIPVRMWLRRKEVTFALKNFRLIASSGDAIKATVGAVSISKGGERVNYEDPAVDQTVAQLRMLLRSKKQGGV